MHRNLAQAFDSIPEAKFSYKPTPAQQTIGFIAQHLVNDNYFFCNNFGAMKGTRAAKDTTTADSVKATWPKDTLVTQLKASFKFCEGAIGQLDDAKLTEKITMTFGGQSRNTARANMVLGHALDLGDHYSQLANYMRLNGMPPPTKLPRPRPPANRQLQNGARPEGARPDDARPKPRRTQSATAHDPDGARCSPCVVAVCALRPSGRAPSGSCASGALRRSGRAPFCS